MDMRIEFDQNETSWRPGAWLKGNVVIEAPFRNARGVVTVEVTGKEISSVPQKRLFSRCTTISDEEYPVFYESMAIHDCEEHAVHGHKAIPFAVFLPLTLAPSMHFQGDQDGLCGVQYSITARLNSKSASSRFKVKGEAVPPPSTKDSEDAIVVKPAVFPVYKKGRRRLGDCLLVGAKVAAQGKVGKGASLGIQLASRNESRLDIQRVDLRVVEEIRWHMGAVSKERSVLLAYHRDVKVPSVLTKRAGKLGSRSKRELQAEMEKELSGKDNFFFFKVPSRARCSYSGELMDVSHVIEVVFVVRDGATSPRLRIPIDIAEKPLVEATSSLVVPLGNVDHGKIALTNSRALSSRTLLSDAETWCSFGSSLAV